MLNILSNTEAAANPRAGSVLGAFAPGYVGAFAPDGTDATPRPRLRLVVAADHGQLSALQISSEKYTTRIVAASGGASGPHPARDPV